MTVEMPEFEVPQFYETAIVMRHRGEESDREFRFVCVPIAAIPEESRSRLADPPALLRDLGFSESAPLAVAQLPDAIFTLLRTEALGDDAGPVLDRVSDANWLARQRQADPDAALFAEYLAFGEVVPFEQSKVTGYALSTLAMSSYSAAKGLVSGAPHAAVVFGPHAPVAYAAVVGVAGTVAVIDSIGVVVGVVTSPRTREVLQKAREGIRRLIQRPQSPAAPDSRDQPATQMSKTPQPEGKQSASSTAKRRRAANRAVIEKRGGKPQIEGA
jgi:hypothetical protein